MKIKSLIVACSMMIAGLQPAQASYCDNAGIMPILVGYMAIISITSAPTGTTLVLSSECSSRDEVLALKDAAIEYRMTGEMSPLLESALIQGQEVSPSLTPDQIVNKFIHVNVQ